MWVRRIGKVAGLRALNLLDVDPGPGVAAVGSATQGRDLAAFTPEVRLAGVMVIGQAEGRPVPDNLTEIAAELEPGGVVPVVVVDLVPREEEDVGIDLLHVRDDVFTGDIAPVRGMDGVPGERGHDDFVPVHRIPADRSSVGSPGLVGDPVLMRPGVIPVFNPEGSSPALLDRLGPRHFNPLPTLFDLKTHRPAVARGKRVELGRQFEGLVVNSIKGEADEILFRYFRDSQDGATLPLLLILLLGDGDTGDEKHGAADNEPFMELHGIPW